MKLIKDINANIYDEISWEPEKSITSWERWYLHEGISNAFANVSLADLKHVSEIGRETIKKWMLHEINSLVFLGCTGSGKTHCALALMKWIFEKGQWVRFVPSTEILSEGREYGEIHLRKKYGECPYLLIDDLGVESPPHWEIKYFFAVMDERFNRKNKTIITTNLDKAELEAMYSKRSISRIQANWVKFNETDWRFLG